MKKFLLFFLFLLMSCGSAYALITTDNVDRDGFQYEMPYTFATNDLGASYTAVDVTTEMSMAANSCFYYTVPRSGRAVGISVAGNTAATAGAATFDITINGTVTGIQTVIELAPVRSAIGNSGSSGTTYAYMRQSRDDTTVSRGFRVTSDRNSWHDAEHVYGKATPLVAGDRIGVKVTTSSDFASTIADYMVEVYVLE